MKITPFSLADEEHANTAQLVELDSENQFDIFPLQWGDVCKLYPALSMHKYDTAEHVMVGTKIRDGSSQKLMFGGDLSLLQSFKGGAGTFPESMVML